MEVIVMMSLKKTLLVTCLLAASGGTFAAPTADLQLTGKIVPNSCDVTFSNSGIVDLGEVKAADIKQDETTTLPRKHLRWDVVCGGPTAITAKWVDNKVGDGVPGGINPRGYLFSLGKDSANTPIGSVIMHHGAGESVTVTGGVAGLGGTANVIISADNGTTWTNSAYGEQSHINMISYSAGTTSFVPEAYTTYSSNMAVTATLAKGEDLVLTDSLDFGSNATMQISYY